MRKSQKLLILSIGISLITISALIYFTTKEGIIQSFTKIRTVYLLVALGFHFLGWLFWGARTKLLARASGLDISFVKSTEIVLSSTFMAAITPSYAGGEPSRIYLLGKEENGSAGGASAIVLGERALDVIFLVFAGTISLFVLSSRLGGILNIKILLIFAATLMVILGTILFLSLFKLKKIENFISMIERPIEKIRPGTIKLIYEELDSFHEGLWMFIRNGKYELGLAFILTVLQWTLEFSIPYVLLVGLGAQVNFIPAWASYALVLFIVMIPLTPGGSGMAELGATAIYSAISTTGSIGIFTLLLRFVTYYTNLGVGGFISSKVLKDLDEMEKEID